MGYFSDSSMLERLSPGTTLSHFRVLSRIGAGGMGEVYLAEDTQRPRADIHAELSRLIVDAFGKTLQAGN